MSPFCRRRSPSSSPLLLAAAAQAGLWGETYLVTQAMAGMLRGTPSLPVIVLSDWKTGAAKGAVYGFVFMALLLVAGMVVTFPPALGLLVAAGPVAGALIGAATFPLVARHRREHGFDAALRRPAAARISADHQFPARRRRRRGGGSGASVRPAA